MGTRETVNSPILNTKKPGHKGHKDDYFRKNQRIKNNMTTNGIGKEITTATETMRGKEMTKGNKFTAIISK